MSMSALSEILLALGGVVLGAYALERLFSGGGGGNTCTGTTTQTCIGPVCWFTCVQSLSTVGNPQAVPGNVAGTLTGLISGTPQVTPGQAAASYANPIPLTLGTALNSIFPGLGTVENAVLGWL